MVYFFDKTKFTRVILKFVINERKLRAVQENLKSQNRFRPLGKGISIHFNPKILNISTRNIITSTNRMQIQLNYFNINVIIVNIGIK